MARLPPALRRHAWLIGVLLAGFLLRILVQVAYPEAFYFPDSQAYVARAVTGVPHEIRPYGYSFFLKPFTPGPLGVVAMVQHVMGLAIVALGYVFLVGRGVRRWLAALAVFPIALDSRAVTLEHYVLAETLFTLLLTGALLLLMWRPRPSAAVAATVGLLLAAASLTRSVGTPVLVLAFVWMLVRGAGWRQFVALAVAFVVPLGGYLVWYNDHHHAYAITQYQGRFLYARVQTFADCGRLTLTERQRTLCPDEPLAKRAQRNDAYVWTDRSPGHRLYPGVEHDPFLNDYAFSVIAQQPVDYAVTVLREVSWHAAPNPPLDRDSRCLVQRWSLPARPGASSCDALLYTTTSTIWKKPTTPPQAPSTLRATLADYSRAATTPGPVLVLTILIVVAATVRWRRIGTREITDALLLALSGSALIVFSVATSMFETRYAVPTLPLLFLGAALAFDRLMSVSRPAR